MDTFVCDYAKFVHAHFIFQAGFSGEGTPKAVFPTLVGRPRHMVSNADT